MFSILSQTGYQVSENSFPEEFPGLQFPYIVYEQDYTDNFFADGKVYQKVQNYVVYLHMDGRRLDRAVQKTLEDVMDANDLLWEESDAYYDEDESHFVVEYEVGEWRS